MEERPSAAGSDQDEAKILPPTEIVIADLVRALDSSWRMDIGLSSAALWSVSFIQAMYGLLIEKGILTQEELEARAAQVMPMVAESFEEEGIVVHTFAADVDKYHMEARESAGVVDCENRIHLCHGACCTFDILLSQQDLDEGVVQWDLEDPYVIRHGDDGYCVHQDRQSRMCTVYEHRPAVCRAYSCKTDKRVWADFDAYVPAPDLVQNLEAKRRERSHVELGAPRRRRLKDDDGQQMAAPPG